MEKRDFGVTILILVLLVALGAAGEYNYQRNAAAEERSGARTYRGYSDAQIASLIKAYEQEVEALDSRYDAAKNRDIQTRGGGLIDQQIGEFERAQKASASTRSDRDHASRPSLTASRASITAALAGVSMPSSRPRRTTSPLSQSTSRRRPASRSCSIEGFISCGMPA